MRLLSIRIEDHDGSPRLGIRRARRRLVGLILALIPFGLGLLGLLTRDDRRGFWDRRAGTDVVPARSAEPVVSQAPRLANRLALDARRGQRRGDAEPGSRSRTRRRGRRSRPSPSSAPTRCGRSSPRPARRSPAGRSSGSRGAPRSCSRRARWLVANAERVVDDDLRRDRPPGRRDPVRRALLRARGARVLGQAGARLPRRRGDRVGVAVRARPPDGGPLRAARRRRRDRPLELPAQQLVRRLHPGARRRQRRGHEAVRGHPADLAADGRDAGRVRDPRGRLPGRHRPRRDRRGADRRGRLRDVHRLGRDRARR